MKKILIAILLLMTVTAFAEGQFGVGAIIGNPTGLSGKYFLSETTAIDGAAAFSVGGKSKFSIHSDYLFHNPGALVFQDTHPLDVYYGIGGRMKFSDDIELGVRLPVGLAHMLENNQADVFAEIAPIVDFVGRVGLELSLGFGARYYF